MELIERIPLARLQFLTTLKFCDFKALDLCKSDSKNDDDRKQNYNYLMSYCNGLIKAKGEMKRAYTFTNTTPLEVGGRLYCGLSIQGISSKIRGFLLDGYTTDIDMKNAHPVILHYICKLQNISCPNLEYYINNRDEILARFDTTGKTDFLKAVNSDKSNKKITDKFFKDFDKECKEIQKEVTKNKEYKHIVETVPVTRHYNWLGSAINRILCVYENKILQEIINYLIRKEIEICSLMFDGLMVYGNYYDDEILLKELEKCINTKFEGLNMKLSYKEHKTGIIDIPDDFQIEDKSIVIELEKSFEKVSKEFEKQHCKITNKGIFIKQLDNDNIVMSRQHLITAYENMIYEKLNKDDKLESRNFIRDWIASNPEQRRYEDIGIYPDDSKCPANYFNMWRKFEMEMVTEYEHKQEALDLILNHIRILCNNEEPVYDYFIAWIAQMIQYPAVKSTCPTFISKEGSGKGTLMRLFEKMLGDSKIFQTSTPSRDVFGEFNNHMANSFLVNLDELSKKETLDSEGKIKALITEPKLTINNKGINKFDIQSYHRFIITTNNEEPIVTKSDDRRKFIIRSSDEKIGDKEYFKTLYEYMDDVNVVKTCYEYFKSIPDMQDFNKLTLPSTEYQNELKEMSKSPIESWLYDFTLKNQDRDIIELKPESILERFNEWTIENGVEYNIDSLKLMVRMNRLKINGIEKHHTKKGNVSKFNIELMKKHFGIGLLL
jgi:putative DNA primase/helicase